MLSSFEVLGLSAPLMQAVEQLGYQEPTPIQQQAVPVLLEGRNVLGQAQTGTGKTAAFVLPMLQNIQPGAGGVQALVLAPTRELAIQVAQATKEMSRMTPVRVLPVYGGQSYDIQIRQLKRGVDVVVGTPGRLLDLMRQEILNLSHVSYLVLDEADEMLDMGFIEDIEAILAQIPADRQMALFSATLPPAVRRLAERYLSDPHEITINPEHRTVKETDQSYIRVLESEKTAALIRLLEVEEVKSALVFARTKMGAQDLADRLVERGYPAEALHGDLSQTRREFVLNRFRQGSINLLIATDVAARGLDIDSVSHVFNFDVPEDAEDYVHRIGRTGRAGRKGVAITFLTPRDRYRLRQIEAYANATLTERRIPTLEQIAARRDDRLVQRVYEQMIAETGGRERELVQRLVDGGLDLADIAAAALRLSRAGESHMPTEAVTELPERSERSHRKAAAFEPYRERAPRSHAVPASNSEAAAPSRSGETGALRKPHFERESAPAAEAPGSWKRGKGPRSKDDLRPEHKPRRDEPGMVRLWMNLGELHGLRPGDVVGAIASEVGIPGKAIGEIDIRNDHSFVHVSEKHVRQVLRQSSGNYLLRGKPVMLKLA